MNILWKLNSFNPEIASTRYRCLIPVYESLAHSVGMHHFIREEVLFDLPYLNIDVAVFSKTVKDTDVQWAEKLKAQGVKVIYDACDNLLANNASPEAQENFKALLKLADQVTVPTELLKKSLLSHLHEEGSERILVIPDPSENSEHIQFAREHLKNRVFRDVLKLKNMNVFIKYAAFFLKNTVRSVFKTLFHWYLKIALLFISEDRKQTIMDSSAIDTHESLPLWMRFLLFPYAVPAIALRGMSFGLINVPYKYRYDLLRKFLVNSRKPSPLKQTSGFVPTKSASGREEIRILWFGNSGTPGVFGMTDLLLIKEALEELAKDYAVSLTVVSNNYAQFEKLRESFSIPLYYIPWTLDCVYERAHQYHCVVLPNPMNDFSKGKSANRTLLSLSLGLPVVATRTPELEKLSDCVLFDNWKESILKCRFDDNFKNQQLTQFKKHFAESPHHPQRVWEQWRRLFERLKHKV